MATNVWKGGAAAIAQVDKLLPGGTIEADDLFIVTINGKALSTAAGGTTVAAVTAAVTAAFNASTEPEFAEITAADATTHITLTADTAGVPFTVTATTTESDGGAADAQTFVRSAITANSGPNDALVDSNWSLNDVPEDDSIVFEDSAVDCLYNLNQLGTVPGTPLATALTVKSSYTGNIGLPRNNANGYVEYRPTALALGEDIAAITIGEGDGNGSKRINLAMGNLAIDSDIVVYKTGTRADPKIPAMLLTTGTQSEITTIVVNRGDVGIAFYAGTTAVVTELKMGYVTNVSTDANVIVGSGATLPTITKNGGNLVCDTNVTTLENNEGNTTIRKSATVGTATLGKGTLYYNTSGTLTTVHVTGGSVLDLRQDARSRTVTNATLYQKGAIHDPSKTVTWSNGIDLTYCGLSDVTLELGENITLTPS